MKKKRNSIIKLFICINVIAFSVGYYIGKCTIKPVEKPITAYELLKRAN